MTRTIHRVVVMGTAVLALTGCAMTEPFVQLVNDSHMTTSIKTRLATDAHLSTLTGVGVHTSNDVVRLTGTVADVNLDVWTLSIAPQGSDDFRTLATGETPVANGTLAS